MLDVLEPYTEAALGGARTRAALLAEHAVRELDHVGQLVTQLFAPSQVEVGRRWQERSCSVGEEHLATFVTESVLTSVTLGMEPDSYQGTFVIACGEGEWHGLPARMTSELLVLAGWRVVHLGTATPADHLAAYLAGVHADAIGISVTMSSNLPGALRSIEVARRQGIPAVVGGRAFGGRVERARAVGADGYSCDATDLTSLEAVLFDERTPPLHADEMRALQARRNFIVRDAVEHAASITRSEGQADQWLSRFATAVDHSMGVIEAAVLCDDPSVITDELRWRTELAAADGIDAEIELAATEVLLAVTPGYSGIAGLLIERAIAELG